MLCIALLGLTVDTDYHGFQREDFKLGASECVLVKPAKPAKNQPWIWRMEFFDHRPELDLALLKKGWHLAYINVGNTFGAPAAVAGLEKLYAEMVRRGFSKKPVLEGFSRGGLYAYQFAARNPDKVGVIYGDAPVLDFKTWPYGGKGGKRSDEDWNQVKTNYGFADDRQAMKYPFNPVDNLEVIRDAKIPVIHVVGDADEVVPVEANTNLFEKRFKALGGVMEVIHKPGGLHHPHSLDDPTPLVKFIEKHQNDTKNTPAGTVIAAPNTESRSGSAGWGDKSWLEQHQEILKLARERKPNLVLLGDSITQGWGGGGRSVWQANPDAYAKYLEPLNTLSMGLSGDRTQNVLWRINQGALDTQPANVGLMIGINNIWSDSAKDIFAGQKMILDAIKKKSPKSRIYVFATFPYRGKSTDGTAEKVVELNKLLGAETKKRGLKWIDLSDQLDASKMAGDGVHLAKAGYEVWGRAIAENIKK